jgi:hypothetical protein
LYLKLQMQYMSNFAFYVTLKFVWGRPFAGAGVGAWPNFEEVPAGAPNTARPVPLSAINLEASMVMLLDYT